MFSRLEGSIKGQKIRLDEENIVLNSNSTCHFVFISGPQRRSRKLRVSFPFLRFESLNHRIAVHHTAQDSPAQDGQQTYKDSDFNGKASSKSVAVPR